MCSPKKCSICGKTGWTGCGQHVDQVMKNVAVQDRCKCSAQDKANAKASAPGIFARIFK